MQEERARLEEERATKEKEVSSSYFLKKWLSLKLVRGYLKHSILNYNSKGNRHTLLCFNITHLYLLQK